MKPLLLAALAATAPVPASLLLTSPTSSPAPLAEPSEDIVLDASALPGPTGWVLHTLRAEAPTNLTFDLRVRVEGYTEGSFFSPILARPDQPAPEIFPAGMWWPPALQVNNHGERVECCPPFPSVPGMQGYSSRFRMNGTVELAPGQAMQVGAAAIDADPTTTMRFIAHVNRGRVALEGPVTGSTVERIDLVDRAYSDGQNLRMGGWLTIGQSAPAHVTWSAREAGLLGFWYLIEGEARGRFAATLPNGDVYDSGRSVDISGFVVAAIGPGPYQVSARDVKEAGVLPGWATGRWSWEFAGAVFADIPLEMRGVLARQHEREE